MNQRTHVTRVADRLEAIAQWQMDQVSAETKTAKLLMEAVDWLRKLHNYMCRHGYIGCPNGDYCIMADSHAPGGDARTNIGETDAPPGAVDDDLPPRVDTRVGAAALDRTDFKHRTDRHRYGKEIEDE